jgi:excisionase family DNA binding protein
MQRDETVLAVGVLEAARRLGLSARTVATLVAQRQLASRKVGRRRIIPVAALEVFIRRGQTNSGRTENRMSHARGEFDGSDYE